MAETVIEQQPTATPERPLAERLAHPDRSFESLSAKAMEARQEATKAIPARTEGEKRFEQAEKDATKFAADKLGLELPEEKGEPVQSEAKPESKPETAEGETDGTESREGQTLDDRILEKASKDIAFEDVVSALSETTFMPPEVQGERKELIREAVEQFSGAELKSVLKSLSEPLFPASREGFARHQVAAYALSQIPNQREVILFLARPDSASIIKAAQTASPQQIAQALHQISADLRFPEAVARRNAPPAETKAPRPPSEVGGRASAPPDQLEAATKNRDFRSFEREMSRRWVERQK